MLLVSNKKWDALNQQVKAMQSANLNRFVNFSSQIFPIWKEFENAYETMDMVYSVIKKLATNAAMIPFYGYDKKKDTDLPDEDLLVKFLDTLDFEQKEIMYTYLWTKGEVFGFKEVVELGVNQGSTKLTFLHPDLVTVVLSESFPVEIVGYNYTDVKNGISFPIDLEDMVFIKMPNPSSDPLKKFRGFAPVHALTRTLTRVSSEDDVAVAQLQNGGVPSIVFDKSPNLSPEVMGIRKDTFGRFLRNSSNVGAPYFAAGEMGHIALGSNLVDMNVAELGSVDFGRICNAFGVSTTLFNDKSASTESNVQEMVKEMYINTIIPNVIRIESALNKYVVPGIKTKGIIQADTSEIKALHDDEAKKATALSTRWWITPNEKRETEGWDRIVDDPLMDKIVIPSSMMLIEDLEIVVEPVDNAAGDYRAPVVPLKQASGS
jgi:HK97 family phage portal protein